MVGMAERLRDQTSPYLLQHAGNPVDWWPWSDEAFAAAAERDVPVLLSVGYSACHWCHVMAHESFEDDATAAIMNENLISIKVDREERPDVDSVYMTATQAMTGQGGWPMTVFMTPDREPFYCGTYFPRQQFQQLVLGVARAWREERSQVSSQAGQIAAALAERAGVPPPRNPAWAAEATSQLRDATDAGVSALAAEFDAARGGFGGAPKFPPSMVVEFLIRHAERTAGAGRMEAAERQDAVATGPQALAMAATTADAMARGGMYDQLAGGFARYSVDADWVVPHFEKMLYDNALLARVYIHLWRFSGSRLARRVAEETCEWMIAELRTAEGGFASALDADSDGVEGAFYVWNPAQLAEALGPADAEYAAGVFGVTQQGTFEHGSSVLQLRADPQDADRFAGVRAALLNARAKRTRPGRDDKIVAAWNGLAIAALAEAGLALGRADFISVATEAAELLAGLHVADGRLTRTSKDGVASDTAGVLDDYGSVAEGLIALASATAAAPGSTEAEGPARWLGLAGQLLDTALARFGTGTGGFYDTAEDSERLIYRPIDIADGPSPSGTFAVAAALLSYGALTGSANYRDAATSALSSVADLAARFPRAAGWGLAAAEAALSGPVEIAVAGSPSAERAQLHLTAFLAAPPGAVIVCGEGDDAGIPLLTGRKTQDDRASAYVCRNFTCRAPVFAADELRTALSAHLPTG